MTTLEGHEEPWREWRAALASQRMHHAWILSGPRGVGKGSFARDAAAALVAVPGTAPTAVDHHPDILIPRHPPATKEDEKKRDNGEAYTTKRSIPIDEIRALQHRLVTRPTLGPRRAIIIDPADDLETGAVNALLKSLEEPPVGTFFLLVTHRLGRLLPTIRSRCRILRFAPLADEVVDRILRADSPGADHATRKAAIAAAQGSPGVALDFVAEDLAKAHDLMEHIMREGDAGFTLRGHLADEVGARPRRERQTAVLDLARSVLAQDLRLASPIRQARIIEAYGALTRLAREAPTYNYDPGLLAMEIGALLASAAVPTEAGNR
ncbi:MAG: DNA polymerase III subunit delta' [Sphingomonadales bacterium]|nr:DNA polymerase III subunit delta' [Sphingomonadales bacterium]MDE2170633.1 DNA polymerase III subunit delta' [Sphingomonadales bacterium]